MKDKQPIGVSLLIDFAFKLAFGNEKEIRPLVSLLNAILAPKVPVVEVAILNPFKFEEFQGDKLSILDIKARDANGMLFDIEMQLSTTEALPQRMAFYGCALYSQQLVKGDSYGQLCPVYVICLLDDEVWKESDTKHHQFRLHDGQSGLTLVDTLEVHFLELPKYNLTEDGLVESSNVERWIYLLRHAEDYDIPRLRELFPDPACQLVIDTLEEITMKTEYREIYDSREKARLDELWRITAAERRGERKGKLVGKIQAVQELFGEAISNDEELFSRTYEELESIFADLQARLHHRPA